MRGTGEAVVMSGPDIAETLSVLRCSTAHPAHDESPSSVLLYAAFATIDKACATREPRASTQAGRELDPRVPCRSSPNEAMTTSRRPVVLGRIRTAWAFVFVAGIVAAGIILRFSTHSDLWLDEAQTVAIARLPLRDLPAALRHDGAPPLYYVLLHLWMEVFGQGNLGGGACSPE